MFAPGTGVEIRRNYNRSRRILLTALFLYALTPELTNAAAMDAAARRAGVRAPDTEQLRQGVVDALETLRGLPLDEVAPGAGRGRRGIDHVDIATARDLYPAGTSGDICRSYSRARKAVLTTLRLLAFNSAAVTRGHMEHAAEVAGVDCPNSAQTMLAIAALLATLRGSAVTSSA